MTKPSAAVKVLKHLSAPATLVLIGYTLAFALVLLPIDLYMPGDNGLLKKRKYHIIERVGIALTLIIPAAFYVYTINCTRVGGCNRLSWFLASVVFLWIMLFVAVSFLLAVSS